jgi:hypothetical protein
MRQLVRRFLDQKSINSLNDIAAWGYDPTSRQRRHIAQRISQSADPNLFREVFASKFVSDKFGEATTHWRKLEDRIHRGVGNPCPLVFIGLPASIVTFDDAGEVDPLSDVLDKLPQDHGVTEADEVEIAPKTDIAEISKDSSVHQKVPRV